MSKHKHLALLIGTQTLCIALGLWIHQRFVVAELQVIVEQRAAAGAAVESKDLFTAAEPSLWAAGGMTLFWTCGLLGIFVYLIVSRCHDENTQNRARPEIDELRRVSTLVRTQESIIFGLAKLADSRDPETGDHLERISLYSSILASALRRHDDFRETLTPAFVQFIGISSALHDIGKVGVEDAILRKPGPLTRFERIRMQDHASIGEECLKEIEHRLGESNFLQMAREIAAAHHERWDGRGYPCGLKGDEIPLAARIVSIADVYDALSSRRVYKDAFPHEKCVEIIQREAGKQFDPRLVQVFLEIEMDFRDIARQFGARPETEPQISPATAGHQPGIIDEARQPRSSHEPNLTPFSHAPETEFEPARATGVLW